jgi:hypothetical protein
MLKKEDEERDTDVPSVAVKKKQSEEMEIGVFSSIVKFDSSILNSPDETEKSVLGRGGGGEENVKSQKDSLSNIASPEDNINAFSFSSVISDKSREILENVRALVFSKQFP